MKKVKRNISSLRSLFSVFLTLGIFLTVLMFTTFGCEATDPEPVPDIPGVRPIVFVHGMAGSADQFQEQALRFASNGYPDDFFFGYEYNTIVDPDRTARLKDFIDDES